MVQSRNLTLSFSSESSIEEELKRESTADVITILVSKGLLFSDSQLVVGRSSCIMWSCANKLFASIVIP